jgi:hypothetical protein
MRYKTRRQSPELYCLHRHLARRRALDRAIAVRTGVALPPPSAGAGHAARIPFPPPGDSGPPEGGAALTERIAS